MADFRALDSDGDGLGDAQEKTTGTDRRKPDTDGDGLGDGAEVKNGCKPLDRDSDDDGMSDDYEGIVVATGLLRNTDSDDTPDYIDVDSDNDGIFDALERGAADALAVLQLLAERVAVAIGAHRRRAMKAAGESDGFAAMDPDDLPFACDDDQIGRASCRERV